MIDEVAPPNAGSAVPGWSATHDVAGVMFVLTATAYEASAGVCSETVASTERNSSMFVVRFRRRRTARERVNAASRVGGVEHDVRPRRSDRVSEGDFTTDTFAADASPREAAVRSAR